MIGEINIKYFVEIQLTKSKLAEVVYANGAKNAEAIAEANSQNIIEQWGEIIRSFNTVSFYELGEMACACHADLIYVNGDYYYKGRKVSENTHFINGYGHAYELVQRQENFEDQILYKAV